MAIPNDYNVSDQVKGVNGFGTQFCTKIYSSTLGAGTEATLTVPGVNSIGSIVGSSKAQYIAVFSYEPSKKVYVALNGTAAVPAGNTLAATTSELNPPAKTVQEGDVIHVISAAAADISIALYTLPVR